MLDSQPFENFEQASQEVLTYLRERLDLALWMITRTEEDDWIVLHSEDRAYGIDSGAVLRWSDSLCARMVTGAGPRMAPRSREIDAYAEAPLGRQLEIGAYVGVPLTRSDGSLFGTLCGIDPNEREQLDEHDLATVELLARMLSTLLERELQAIENERVIERLEHESTMDPLTVLRNRRGWQRKLQEEEARTRRLGSPACLWVIDLDKLKQSNDQEGHRAGDQLLQRTASAIRSMLRESDVAARVGGDEFTVLALECDRNGATELHQRLTLALGEAGIEASIGSAMRDPHHDLLQSWEAADRALYREKSHTRERAI